MKAGNRVRVIHELEPDDEEDFTFVGMTGTVKKSYPDGVIVNLDDEFLGDNGKDLFFEYAEVEKMV